MNIIGYWMRSLLDDDLPMPQELVGQYDSVEKTAVAEYLDSGSELADYRGTSWCRFGCTCPMGSRELTDGRWVWPEGLSHYVRDHNVQLPEEFIACVWPSASESVARARDGEPQVSYWVDWCRQKRSHSLRERIIFARKQAEAEVGKIAAARVAELESSEGVSDSPCQWAGCSNFALSGRALCASCLVKADFVPQITQPYMDFRLVLTPHIGDEKSGPIDDTVGFG